MPAPLPELLDALRQALGPDRAALLPAERGAVGNGGKVAWIETRSDVAQLRVVANGEVVIDRSLAQCEVLNFGYEGCSAGYIEWFGDQVAVISQEAPRTTLRCFGLDGSIDSLDLQPGSWVHEDMVLWPAEGEPGLLAAAALPSLAPCTPLPIRAAPRHCYLSGDAATLRVLQREGRTEREIERLGLPAPAQRGLAKTDGMLARTEQSLLGSAPASELSRLVAEAVALPFVRTRQPQRWSPSPVWLPCYWHRHLLGTGRSAEAAALLSLLDTFAAPLAPEEPESGWDARLGLESGTLTLAVRYVRRQARVQAQVCRTGNLPAGWWCLLFEPAPGSSVPGSRVDPATLPPVARAIFETLAATAPPPFPHRF